MTFTCNLETFIAMFDSESDAIEHILLASDDGRVESAMYTIPYYTFNRLANPPRFIAYGDHAPQVYSYEVRINASKCSDNDVIIEFPMSDLDAIDWFSEHLHQRLSDGWGDYETDEVNITDEYELERTALALQLAINIARMRRTRKFLQDTSPEYITDALFDQNCHYITHTTEENKAITKRIENIDYIIEDRQRA
tara:strand:+ start:1352 stop:1936 length:585 start_codon:yes stop_codon:yes gene_type:complete